MAATPSDTPSVRMPARDRRFCGAGMAARWYMGGDPVPSAFFSALSATFPLGEKFFIDSVRRYRGQVSARLADEIDAFVRQEALHTREHLAFNRLVADSGYDAEGMTARTRARLDRFRARSAIRQLGFTIALEHFTALFAHEVLRCDRRLASAPDHIRALWRWHAMEEIEHKAVVFDAFAEVTRGWSAARRYAFRVWAMLEASWILCSTVAGHMHDLFTQDGSPQPRTWGRALAYFFGPRGVLTSLVPSYLAWFRPGFHPWDVDDHALAAEVDREMGGGTGAADAALA